MAQGRRPAPPQAAQTPKLAAFMDEAEADVFADMSFPAQYRAKSRRCRMFSTGISRPSKTSSRWPSCSSSPMVAMRRSIFQPGWSRSNRQPLRG